VLLIFAWKGSSLDLKWPPDGIRQVTAPKPDPAILAWAEPLRPILPKMSPKDREYLANFYDAMAFILLRDGDRSDPVIGNTDAFAVFHGGSLRSAVDRKDVGKYPGLGEAIDQVFISASGADVQPMDAKVRGNVIAACGVLSWTFSIHGE
jgi:hypothetical protein